MIRPAKFIAEGAWRGEKPTAPLATASIAGKLVKGWWVTEPEPPVVTSPTPTMPAEARPEDLDDFMADFMDVDAGPAPGAEVSIETGQAPGGNKVGGHA